MLTGVLWQARSALGARTGVVGSRPAGSALRTAPCEIHHTHIHRHAKHVDKDFGPGALILNPNIVLTFLTSLQPGRRVPDQAGGAAGAAPAAEGPALPAAASAPGAEACAAGAEVVARSASAPGAAAGQAHEVTKPQVRGAACQHA